MFAARLAALGLVLLFVIAPGAGAQTNAAKAPRGLHGFLLRADEPVAQSFPRTPSFAWNPVAGAVRYQFQLATSSTFRENGIVFAKTGLTTPVVAPTITLPWITSSLYARVRAVLAHGASPWSAPFRFNVTPNAAPKPLPSKDGLLRWTPVEGATAYEVWFVDIPKVEVVYSNVIDEREFYTFHRDTNWTGSVRWRIRARRDDRDSDQRANGMPAVGYGPWSPVYSSSNAPYHGGPIQLVGTVADTISDGSPSSPSHRVMPGFAFTGDQTLDGLSAELFRVYVYTDKTCLNRVLASSVVGGPAYAPRPFGPLALPTSAAAVALARGQYLPDGAEPLGAAFDGEQIQSSEELPSATATTAVPSDSDTNPSGSSSSPPGAPAQLKVSGNWGAPVDLWDTDWPSGGYYWTVIPVAPMAPPAQSTVVAAAGALVGGTSVPVVSSAGFGTGDTVQIGSGGNAEMVTVTSTTPGTIVLAAPLKFTHGGGEPVVRTGGNIEYRDLELPEDVCAAGRVARFGKDSEPALTASGELFASGLSSSGRLTAGRAGLRFYGSPLVAWTPAMGADAYEVQWSKTRYPFKAQPDPETQGAPGRMTLGTSAVLPLKPGTWYYRVRGFSFTLPTGAQQLSWSDPAKIVVAKPKFKIVGGK